MNTLHRFFAVGLLTSLSCAYTSAVLAEPMYQQSQYQQEPQQYQQTPQYQQPQHQRSYGEKVGNKALNGITNISTAGLEMPKSIINNINTDGGNIVFGVIGGVIEGTLNTAGRLAAGVGDLVLAPLPTKAIVQPQYVWDNFYETKTTYSNLFRLDDNERQPIFAPPRGD